MKRVMVECMFPELRGGNIYKVGRGEATNVKAAISRAFGEALKQVRGKRITTIKATLTIINIEPEETNVIDPSNSEGQTPVSGRP